MRSVKRIGQPQHNEIQSVLVASRQANQAQHAIVNARQLQTSTDANVWELGAAYKA